MIFKALSLHRKLIQDSIAKGRRFPISFIPWAATFTDRLTKEESRKLLDDYRAEARRVFDACSGSACSGSACSGS